MKNILTIFLLTLAVNCFGQTYGHNIRIDPSQDPDTANVGVVYPSGNANRTGRLHFVSYETLAARINEFISGSGISDGDKGDITISGMGATFTIDNGLNATKIADGTVSSTEFQFINTLTSNAQTQINTKAALGANTDINSVVLDNTGLKIKLDAKNVTLSPGNGGAAITANRTVTVNVNDGDRTLDLQGDLTVFPGGASISGSNTGDQDLSGYSLDANVVHKTGGETIAGEKTFTGTAIAGQLLLPMNVGTLVPMSFAPTLPYTKSYLGPARAIEFLGGTSPSCSPPYCLSAYFAESGGFSTGVPIIMSNKRVDINGEIQGVSALSDGSEPTMLSISPDVNGPSIAVEAHGTMTGGTVNQSAIAVYNLDAITGGATSYSAGYGTKQFVLTGNGTMLWGSDLSNDPVANQNLGFLGPDGSGGLLGGKSLSLKAATGQAYLVLNGPATGQNETIRWQKNGVDKWQMYQSVAATSDLYVAGPSGVFSLAMMGANGRVGINETGPSSMLDVKSTGTDYDTKIMILKNSAATSVFTVTSDGRTYFGGDVGTNAIMNVTRSTGNPVSDLFLLRNADGLDMNWFSGATYFNNSIDGATGKIAWGNTGVNNEQMVLNTANSRLGIGNNDPQQTLDVTGTARITGSGGTATAPMGRDGDGDVSAMTAGAGISYTGGAIVNTGDTDGTNDVLLTGDQTVAGVKTFSSMPSVPTHTPANASATGITGQIAWDASFIYVCVNTNTWVRAPIASW